MVVSSSTWLTTTLTAMKNRKCLGHARWMQCLDNLPGLKVFWAELNNAQTAAEKDEWMDARRCLEAASGLLIKDANNELFFGHESFRLLQSVYSGVQTWPNESLLPTITLLAQKLSAFKV